MLLARRNLMLAVAVVVAGSLNGRSEAQLKGGPDYRRLAEAKELHDACFAVKNTWRSNGADIKNELVKNGLLGQDAVVRVRPNATKYRLNYYVAWDAHTVYVAFRGTDPIHTATLLLASPTPYGVHPGLNDAALAVLPEIKNILAAANISGKKVVIAGHSMGGVLAEYVAHNLMLESKLYEASVFPSGE